MFQCTLTKCDFFFSLTRPQPINRWWLDYPREWFAPISGVNWYNTKTICSLYPLTPDARRRYTEQSITEPYRALTIGWQADRGPVVVHRFIVWVWRPTWNSRPGHVSTIKGFAQNIGVWMTTKIGRGRRVVYGLNAGPYLVTSIGLSRTGYSCLLVLVKQMI